MPQDQQGPVFAPAKRTRGEQGPSFKPAPKFRSAEDEEPRRSINEVNEVQQAWANLVDTQLAELPESHREVLKDYGPERAPRALELMGYTQTEDGQWVYPRDKSRQSGPPTIRQIRLGYDPALGEKGRMFSLPDVTGDVDALKHQIATRDLMYQFTMNMGMAATLNIPQAMGMEVDAPITGWGETGMAAGSLVGMIGGAPMKIGGAVGKLATWIPGQVTAKWLVQYPNAYRAVNNQVFRHYLPTLTQEAISLGVAESSMMLPLAAVREDLDLMDVGHAFLSGAKTGAMFWAAKAFLPGRFRDIPAVARVMNNPKLRSRPGVLKKKLLSASGAIARLGANEMFVAYPAWKHYQDDTGSLERAVYETLLGAYFARHGHTPKYKEWARKKQKWYTDHLKYYEQGKEHARREAAREGRERTEEGWNRAKEIHKEEVYAWARDLKDAGIEVNPEKLISRIERTSPGSGAEVRKLIGDWKQATTMKVAEKNGQLEGMKEKAVEEAQREAEVEQAKDRRLATAERAAADPSIPAENIEAYLQGRTESPRETPEGKILSLVEAETPQRLLEGLSPELVSNRSAERATGAEGQREVAPVKISAAEVAGVGTARAKRLSEHFESVHEMLAAGPEGIAEVPGIGETLAKRIHNTLAPGRTPENVRSGDKRTGERSSSIVRDSGPEVEIEGVSNQRKPSSPASREVQGERAERKEPVERTEPEREVEPGQFEEVTTFVPAERELGKIAVVDAEAVRYVEPHGSRYVEVRLENTELPSAAEYMDASEARPLAERMGLYQNPFRDMRMVAESIGTLGEGVPFTVSRMKKIARGEWGGLKESLRGDNMTVEAFETIIRWSLKRKGLEHRMPDRRTLHSWYYRIRNIGEWGHPVELNMEYDEAHRRPVWREEVEPAGEWSQTTKVWANRPHSQALQAAEQMGTTLHPLEPVEIRGRGKDVERVPMGSGLKGWSKEEITKLKDRLLDKDLAWLGQKGDNPQVYTLKIPKEIRSASREELLDPYAGEQLKYFNSLSTRELKAEVAADRFFRRLIGPDYRTLDESVLQKRSQGAFQTPYMYLDPKSRPKGEELAFVVMEDLTYEDGSPATDAGMTLSEASMGRLAEWSGRFGDKWLKPWYWDRLDTGKALMLKAGAQVGPKEMVWESSHGTVRERNGEFFYTPKGGGEEVRVSGVIPESAVKLPRDDGGRGGVSGELKGKVHYLKPEKFGIDGGESHRDRDGSFTRQLTNFFGEEHYNFIREATTKKAMSWLHDKMDLFHNDPEAFAEYMLKTMDREAMYREHPDAIRALEAGTPNHPVVLDLIEQIFFSRFADRFNKQRVPGSRYMHLIQDVNREVKGSTYDHEAGRWEPGEIIVGDSRFKPGDTVLVSRSPVNRSQNIRVLKVKEVRPEIGDTVIMNGRETIRFQESDMDGDGLQVVPYRALERVNKKGAESLLNELLERPFAEREFELPEYESESQPWYKVDTRINAMMRVNTGADKIGPAANLMALHKALRVNDFKITLPTDEKAPSGNPKMKTFGLKPDAEAVEYELGLWMQKAVDNAKGNYFAHETFDPRAEFYRMLNIPEKWIEGMTAENPEGLSKIRAQALDQVREAYSELFGLYSESSRPRSFTELDARIKKVRGLFANLQNADLGDIKIEMKNRSYMERTLSDLEGGRYARNVEVPAGRGEMREERISWMHETWPTNNKVGTEVMKNMLDSWTPMNEYRRHEQGKDVESFLTERQYKIAKRVIERTKDFTGEPDHVVSKVKAKILEVVDALEMDPVTRRHFDLFVINGLRRDGKPVNVRKGQRTQAKQPPLWMVSDNVFQDYMREWRYAYDTRNVEGGALGIGSGVKPGKVVKDLVGKLGRWSFRALSNTKKITSKISGFIAGDQGPVLMPEDTNFRINDAHRFALEYAKLRMSPLKELTAELMTDDQLEYEADMARFIFDRVMEKKYGLNQPEKMSRADMFDVIGELKSMRRLAEARQWGPLRELVSPVESLAQRDPFVREFRDKTMTVQHRSEHAFSHTGELVKQVKESIMDAVSEIVNPRIQGRTELRTYTERLAQTKSKDEALSARKQLLRYRMESTRNEKLQEKLRGKIAKTEKEIAENWGKLTKAEQKALRDVQEYVVRLIEHKDIATPYRDEKGKVIELSERDLEDIPAYRSAPAGVQRAVRAWVLPFGQYPSARNFTFEMLREMTDNVKTGIKMDLERQVRAGTVGLKTYERVSKALDEAFTIQYRKGYFPHIIPQEMLFQKNMQQALSIMKKTMGQEWTSEMESYFGTQLLEPASKPARKPGFAMPREQNADYSKDPIRVLGTYMNQVVRGWHRSKVDVLGKQIERKIRVEMDKGLHDTDTLASLGQTLKYLTELRLDATGVPRQTQRLGDLRMKISEITEEITAAPEHRDTSELESRLAEMRAEMKTLRDEIDRRNLHNSMSRLITNAYFSSLLGLNHRSALRNASQNLYSIIRRGFGVLQSYRDFANNRHTEYGPEGMRPEVNEIRRELGVEYQSTFSSNQFEMFDNKVGRALEELRIAEMEASGELSKMLRAKIQRATDAAGDQTRKIAERVAQSTLWSWWKPSQDPLSFQGIERWNREISGLSAFYDTYDMKYLQYYRQYGYSKAEAHRKAKEESLFAARVAIGAEHFDYHTLNKPKLLRDPRLAALFQFKSFTIFQTRLIKKMVRPDGPMKSEDYEALARLMSAKLLAMVASTYTGYNFDRFMDLDIQGLISNAIEIFAKLGENGGDLSDPDIQYQLDRLPGSVMGPMAADTMNTLRDLFAAYQGDLRDDGLQKRMIDNLFHISPVPGNTAYNLTTKAWEARGNEYKIGQFIKSLFGLYPYYGDPLGIKGKKEEKKW